MFHNLQLIAFGWCYLKELKQVLVLVKQFSFIYCAPFVKILYLTDLAHKPLSLHIFIYLCPEMVSLHACSYLCAHLAISAQR